MFIICIVLLVKHMRGSLFRYLGLRIMSVKETMVVTDLSLLYCEVEASSLTVSLPPSADVEGTTLVVGALWPVSPVVVV